MGFPVPFYIAVRKKINEPGAPGIEENSETRGEDDSAVVKVFPGITLPAAWAASKTA
jgi:hypothetical protein